MPLLRRCLPLLVSMTSFLPLMTSLPDFFVASPSPAENLRDALGKAEQNRLMEQRYLSFLHQQQENLASPQTLEDVQEEESEAEPGSFQDMDDPSVADSDSSGNAVAADMKQSGEQSSGERLDDEEVQQLTQDLQDLLDTIHKRVVEVGERKKAWLKFQHLLQESQKKSARPTSHFLRIGRSAKSSGPTEQGLSAELLSFLHLSQPQPDSFSADWSSDSAVDDATDSASLGIDEQTSSRDTAPDEVSDREKRVYIIPRHLRRFLRFGRSYRPRSRFLRFGRSYTPQNHFLRIGRSYRPQNSFLRFGRSYTPRNSFLRIGRSYTPQNSFLRIGRSYAPRNSFLRIGRSYSPQNSFLRIGRSYAPQNSFLRIGRSYAPRNSFLRIGRPDHPLSLAPGLAAENKNTYPADQRVFDNGDSFSTDAFEQANSKRSDDSAKGQSSFLPTVRRSYVRIGRLPSSVFRQRLRQGRQVAPDSTLNGRRSSGFRLTKSGVMRAGKRTI